MKIIIHQSICGEKNKAWDLLKTTMPDLAIAKSIAFKTDLQEQTGDIQWFPAIRGFVEGEYYLIMKTFEDTSVEVRRGRKFSHVLIIRKDDIININNLQPILNLLFERIEKEALIEPVYIELPLKELKLVSSQIFLGRFNKLINGYLKIREYLNTIIWVGQDDFDLAVIELWKRLTSEERQTFKFGISFNNDGITNEKINFIAVPENIQSRFLKSGFFVIGKSDNYIPIEIVEKILIGDETAEHRIDNFKKAIESQSLSREDINLVAKGINTFEQLDTTIDLKKINTLSHIIAKYSESEIQGAQYKSRLLGRVVYLMSLNSYADIVVLRTFKWESFKDSKKVISMALVDWINKNVFQVKEKSSNCLVFFSRLTFDSLNWWDKVIEKELKTFLNHIDASNCIIVYSWLKESPSIFSVINRFLNKSREAESFFLEKIPKKVSEELIVQLQAFSIQNNWLRLYAQLLSRQFEFKKALTILLKIDTDESNFDAIDIILNDKKPKLIIDFAIGSGEPRLLKKAGELLHKTPKLLEGINVLDTNWQIIWLEAIKNGNAIDTGLKESAIHINKLFDSIVSGATVSVELLNKISQSQYGNILSYSNRVKLWEKLDADIETNFLKKTSSVLLEQLSENSTTEIPDDLVLANYITQTGVWDFLYFNRSNIKSVIPIFEKFTQLSDQNLRDYLNNYSGQINAIEATQLGKLINSKKYSNSASSIYSKSSKNNNWRFALAECHYLLDIWQKGSLAFSGILSTVNITADQWWQSTEDLIVELYPNGTSLTTVWKKSGGKESDLIMNTTPSNVWHDILNKLRRNLFKDITMNELLKGINKQYGHNQKFKIIYNLRNNYIKTK